MLILGQEKDLFVNLNNCDTIMADADGDVLAYSGSENTTLGTYESKERAKEIVREIFDTARNSAFVDVTTYMMPNK